MRLGLSCGCMQELYGGGGEGKGKGEGAGQTVPECSSLFLSSFQAGK